MALALLGYVAVSGTFAAVTLAAGGRPPFAVFYILTSMLLMGHVVNGALLNSLAMEDVGHVAGTASAVIGTVTTVGGSLLAALIDRLVDDSVVPFALGFFGYGLLMVGFAVWARRPPGDPAPARMKARPG